MLLLILAMTLFAAGCSFVKSNYSGIIRDRRKLP